MRAFALQIFNRIPLAFTSIKNTDIFSNKMLVKKYFKYKTRLITFNTYHNEMNLNIKKAYYTVFALIFIYTIYGVFKMGEVGGPCNAGIAIIVFMPILLIVTFMQLSSFHIWLRGTKRKFGFSIILSIIGMLFWGGGIIISMDENAIANLFYLSPFLIFCIATLIIITTKISPAKEDSPIYNS
jgi:hypothetical protein